MPRRSHGWLALVAALVVLALSGCQTGAASKHPGTSKAAAPSSTAHAAAVQPVSKIAFISNRTGTYNVYVANADGGGVRQLTRFRSGDVGRPALAPDGKSVVFDRSKTADGGFDIWIVRSDGHGLRDLTPGPNDDTAPSWSPDGTKVLFASDRGGAYDIFLMKANGKSIVQLSDRGRGDVAPAFSRDGKRIAFVECDQSLVHCQLWAMNANGKGARRLTKTPVEAERPSWSLNNTKLAVTVKQAGNLDVAVVVVRSGALQRLTHGGADDFQPSYSPDGTRIAFSSNRAGPPSLYVMQADGTQVSSLTSPNKGQDEAPHWQPPTVGG